MTPSSFGSAAVTTAQYLPGCIGPAAVHPELFVVPKCKPYRSVRPYAGHTENTSQFEHHRTSGSVVVRCLTPAPAVHVGRDDVHLSGRGRSDLGGVNVFKRPAGGLEPKPLDVGISEAPAIVSQSSRWHRGWAVFPCVRSPGLCKSFDMRRLFEFKAARSADRVCRRGRRSGRKLCSQDECSKRETRKDLLAFNTTSDSVNFPRCLHAFRLLEYLASVYLFQSAQPQPRRRCDKYYMLNPPGEYPLCDFIVLSFSRLVCHCSLSGNQPTLPNSVPETRWATT